MERLPWEAGLCIISVALKRQIKRLKAMESIQHLLASWTDPLAGSAAYKMMENGRQYLQRTHGAILDIAAKSKVDDPMELCTRMVKILGLPEITCNPLIAKSFASHLIIIDREKPY